MKQNDKGFTLMELLIVIAIISVLVAIAIPMFSSQLEKSREVTDIANVRAAYAQVSTEAMLGDTDTAVTVKLKQKKGRLAVGRPYKHRRHRSLQRAGRHGQLDRRGHAGRKLCRFLR
jgi:prepilin-type N-terminal cleavage/methylation domain-containing protein